MMQTPLPTRQLDALPYYLPNLVVAMVAGVGVVVGSVGPWATVAELLTRNGAWLHGTITLVLGAVSGITSFVVLNRARAGVSPRSLLVLVWVAPIAGLICLVIAVIDIHRLATAGSQVQIGWGLWMVAICSAALCITAAVVAMQVGKLSEDSEAWTRTVITIAALVVLGGVVYFTTRPAVVYTQSTPSSPAETVTNTQTVISRSPVPVPMIVPGTPRQITVAGADARGFFAYPGARCNASDYATMIERTTKSVFVVCWPSGGGGYYYKGARLSDGAAIELEDVTPVNRGFEVVNVADGTRYLLHTNGLTIASGGETFFSQSSNIPWARHRRWQVSRLCRSRQREQISAHLLLLAPVAIEVEQPTVVKPQHRRFTSQR